jgi:hypothetical protein
VAHSRDQIGFANDVDVWLQSYKAANHLQKSP